MVNFAVATVILVQLGMLAQTSVALPIEYLFPILDLYNSLI